MIERASGGRRDRSGRQDHDRPRHPERHGAERPDQRRRRSPTISPAAPAGNFKEQSDGASGTDLVFYGDAAATVNAGSPVNLGAVRQNTVLSRGAADHQLGDRPSGGARRLGGVGHRKRHGQRFDQPTGGRWSRHQRRPRRRRHQRRWRPQRHGQPDPRLRRRVDGRARDDRRSSGQAVQVSGTVYREAAGSAGSLPANLIVHAGDSVALAVMNTAASDGYSENLAVSVTGFTGSGRHSHRRRAPRSARKARAMRWSPSRPSAWSRAASPWASPPTGRASTGSDRPRSAARPWRSTPRWTVTRRRPSRSWPAAARLAAAAATTPSTLAR